MGCSLMIIILRGLLAELPHPNPSPEGEGLSHLLDQVSIDG